MGIKTKTVSVKKQRKVSSKTSAQSEVIGDETHDILIDDSKLILGTLSFQIIAAKSKNK